jgi:ABC-type nitrate/sulfonate/bicarbonate transport system substrate-binding protein
MLVVERGFYDAHKAQVDKFIAEQNSVLDWIRANSVEAKSLIKHHLETNTKKTFKDADINDSYSKVRFDSHIDEALMEEMRQAAIDARYLRTKPVLNRYYAH